MTRITAICIDDEENVSGRLTNCLHADFAILATIILTLQCGVQKDSGSVFKAEISLFKCAPKLPLLTRDPSRYRRYFSGIALITPDTEPS